MRQVGQAQAGSSGAAIGPVPRLLDHDRPLRRVGEAVPGRPRREDAVEEVEAVARRRGGCRAGARHPSGSAGGRPGGAAPSPRRSRASPPSARRRRPRRTRPLRSPPRRTASALWRLRSGNIPPWTIPNCAPRPPSPRTARNAARPLRAQRWVSSIERAAWSRVAGYGVHSSSAIATSTPKSPSCSCAALSGVRRCGLPSRWLRKRTPSSESFLFAARDITWKPPESVRIGRCQPTNRCRPPRARISSPPGRSIRW